MNTIQKRENFIQYSLKHHQQLLHQISTDNQQLFIKSLLTGLHLRNTKKLYHGIRPFYQDAQTILDINRQIAIPLFKEQKIMINKDHNQVLIQCIQCGRFMQKFHFCPNCQDVHYCSQTCVTRAVLNHSTVCLPKNLPKIQTALQIQVHIGGDLGRDISIYFQHMLRTSLKLRGKQFIKQLSDYYSREGRHMLSTSTKTINKQNYLIFSNEIKATSELLSQKISIDSMDRLIQIYENNNNLKNILCYILQKGGILIKKVKQIHNNHFHMIFIFFI